MRREPPLHIDRSGPKDFTSRPRRTCSHQSLTTRMLLVCAALAAVQALLNATLIPIAVPLAAASPPAYAIVAGLYSLMPFVSRVMFDTNGPATVTSLLAGLVTATFSPLGLLALAPFLVAGVTIDLTIWSPRRRINQPARVRARLLISAATSGIALFTVSLPVFSAEHLTLLTLTLSLGGRVTGQLAAALGALALVQVSPALASTTAARDGRQAHHAATKAVLNLQAGQTVSGATDTHAPI